MMLDANLEILPGSFVVGFRCGQERCIPPIKKSSPRISSTVRCPRRQMARPIPRFSVSATFSPTISRNSTNFLQPFINFQQFNSQNTSFSYRCSLFCCYAAAKQPKSGSPPPTKKKKKSSGKSNGKSSIEDDFVIEKSSGSRVGVLEPDSDSDSEFESSQSQYATLPLPKPPAGFVLDDQGRVLMASGRRIATIVDSSNNSPLECVIRRVFRNSRGDECMLLCPVDTPVQILKSVNNEGWSAVSDKEVEGILPSAAYALAKIHMHLVYSGFCYTARGGFCYTEEDIFEFHIDNGEDVDGLPTEGVEIVCFNLDGSHYMIYTPSDPLLFVAVKEKDGALKIADDELLEDPAVISAIDEETEFNALVEEEAALLDSLIGKR